MPVLWLAWAAVLAVAGSGCHSVQSGGSRLTADDFTYAVDEVSAQLRDSSFLAGRTPQSPPIIITCQKVENLTTDLIPESEQWMFILKVQNAVPVQQLASQKNIRLQIPPERVEMLRRSGFPNAASGAQPPTHVMTAQFTSAVRPVHDKGGHITQRIDLYHFQYSITNVQTGSVEWTGGVDFKRNAQGGLDID